MKITNKKSNSNLEIIPVILSGGTGSRLWPLSREAYPKQYINLNEKNNFGQVRQLSNQVLEPQKVSQLRKQILKFPFEPKDEQKYFCTSALASKPKKWSKQKVKVQKD